MNLQKKVNILFAISILSFSKAYSQENNGANLSLGSYTCSEFVSEAAHPNTAAKLLRSMMMVSWATGFAAAYDESGVRADKTALEAMGDALGKICLSNPNKLAVDAIVSEVNKLTSRHK